ncbi:MAG TPA: adenosylcobalamin-dependent ribonucleoside-diphosphate reductase [Candidatus Magasanikbacteria bacterium]|nr:adenosylcobalamin-dependent ribonucleoside-diphosphate reductase [Candidatus Magasanikbacteria bacterium]
MHNDSLQTRTRNALSELGEKIFLDRYAVKDGMKASLQAGDTVIVCVNLKTGQREIGIVKAYDADTKEVTVELRDGTIEKRALEHVDKPLETKPEEMMRRVAKAIAQVEKTENLRTEWTEKFTELMDDWKYVPGGRIFTGAGSGVPLTYYNCYVIPSPTDSRGGIFETLGQMAEIMSRGGGVGINVSSLRPRYAYVRGVNGRSSGAVSWASLYSFVTGLIEQGGSRRGALMLILNVWHPDVMDFITSKTQAGKITNANISVGLTDDFMQAVKDDADWEMVFPDVADERYHTEWDGDLQKWKEKGGRVIVHKTEKARTIWNMIIECAWKSAEPGVFFLDRYNKMSNSQYFARIFCTNPCGEQGLPAWGVCNLGHVNLAKFADTTAHSVKWDDLRETVHRAIRFQDNVIDATPYFFEENKKQQMSERRVGMGTIGLAELLIRLGIRYGSEESLLFIDKIYKFIAEEAYMASVELAKEKSPFSQYDERFLESGFMRGMPERVREAVRQYGIRNVTLLTQAPTGTVGTMVGTSTGIEPFYSWTYFRKSRLGVHQENIKIYQDWFDAHPGEVVPDYFVNAMELTPEEHVRVEAAIQRWTDSSISKTCNVPSEYTIEQTAKLYELMYDLGCKGGTIYRDGSRDEQILSTKTDQLGKDVTDAIAEGKLKFGDAVETASVPQESVTSSKIMPRVRPAVMSGMTYRIRTPYGNLFVTINEDEHGPFEVFAQLGKSGGFFGGQTEAICRMVSVALRSGIEIQEVIDQLKGIRGPEVSFDGGEMIFSLPDAIAKILERHVRNGHKQLGKGDEAIATETITTESLKETEVTQIKTEMKVTTAVASAPARRISIANLGHAPVCPSCSLMLQFEEGCMKCVSCGFSKCS